MNKLSLILVLAGAAVLSACTLPQENIPPQGDPGALYTQAAQTVAALISSQGDGSGPDQGDAGTPDPDGEASLQASGTFTIPTYTPQGSGEGTPLPCDRVRFIKDVTIPDEMDLSPGESFTKTWRLQNAGSCTWTIGYLLYFENGSLMEGPLSQDLTSEPVLPGETIDVSVDLVAPQEIGLYQGNWKLRNVRGEGFGIGNESKPFWVKINVVDGAGTMFDFNTQADQAAWGSGTAPVDYLELGDILYFDQPGEQGDPYVALLDQQFLEEGEVSDVLLATYPPSSPGSYIIGRFPEYQVNSGDLLFGRVGLAADANGSCGAGDVTFRISIMVGGDPLTRSTLWERREICDSAMKSFEIDLDSYQGETAQIFLIVIANSDSTDSRAVWDSLTIHR